MAASGAAPNVRVVVDVGGSAPPAAAAASEAKLDGHGDATQGEGGQESVATAMAAMSCTRRGGAPSSADAGIADLRRSFIASADCARSMRWRNSADGSSSKRAKRLAPPKNHGQQAASSGLCFGCAGAREDLCVHEGADRLDRDRLEHLTAIDLECTVDVTHGEVEESPDQDAPDRGDCPSRPGVTARRAVADDDLGMLGLRK